MNLFSCRITNIVCWWVRIVLPTHRICLWSVLSPCWWIPVPDRWPRTVSLWIVSMASGNSIKRKCLHCFRSFDWQLTCFDGSSQTGKRPVIQSKINNFNNINYFIPFRSSLKVRLGQCRKNRIIFVHTPIKFYSHISRWMGRIRRSRAITRNWDRRWFSYQSPELQLKKSAIRSCHIAFDGLCSTWGIANNYKYLPGQ